MTRSMIRPVVSQSIDQATQGGLIHGGREPADQVLEVAGEVRAGPGEGDALGARAVGGTLDPTQVRTSRRHRPMSGAHDEATERVS